MGTHEVINQATPFEDFDAAALDAALREAAERHGGAWGLEELGELGRRAGDPEVLHQAELANANSPVLHTHDRFGHRIDEVEFHRAYHDLMTTSIAAGLHASPWEEERPAAHVVRAAKFSLWSQVEQGHLCPISMTYSIIPALRSSPTVASEWEPRLTSRHYDGRQVPAADKRGATAGMAMTEKQGGSDVRANTTRATHRGDDVYELVGHKWFCSAPMSDLFLVLAQAPAGLSCFAMPRWLPDGTRNAIEIQRLKDKLGNRSNASSEIELDHALGRLVGPEGAGVATILQMVNHTRLDCVLGVTGQMRAGLTQATHHTSQRAAFGRLLIDQPLMRSVLADLAIESEAATATAIRLAAAYDRGRDDPVEAAFARIATAVAKYWICKRAPMFAAEALECFGGNGYVEEGPMARLFRESPLNGIWEGSGNVIALDVLRAIGREPESLAALLAEVELAAGSDPRFDRAVADLHADLGDVAGGGDPQPHARWLTERLALLLQASLMLRFSTPAVADGFCATRLDPAGGRMFGALPAGVDTSAILARAWPPLS